MVRNEEVRRLCLHSIVGLFKLLEENGWIEMSNYKEFIRKLEDECYSHSK